MNNIPNEFNDSNILEHNSTYDENNSFAIGYTENSRVNAPNNNTTQQYSTSKKRRKNAKNTFVNSLFLMLATVAIVEPSIHIPVFSTMFHSTVDIVAEYNVGSITKTHNSISFSLTINDYNINNYTIILVKAGCDNDEYVATISKNILNDHQIVVDNNNMVVSFKKYVSPNGEINLSPGQSYALLILKDGKIDEKQSVTTDDFTYVYGYSFAMSSGSGYLTFDVHYNPLAEYEYMYFELCDTDGSAIPDAYANVAPNSGKPSIEIGLIAPRTMVNIRIYCLPLNMEIIEG